MAEEKQLDLFKETEPIQELGQWKVKTRCACCKRMTVHVRAAPKVLDRWTFRCTECGNVVGTRTVR